MFFHCVSCVEHRRIVLTPADEMRGARFSSFITFIGSNTILKLKKLRFAALNVHQACPASSFRLPPSPHGLRQVHSRDTDHANDPDIVLLFFLSLLFHVRHHQSVTVCVVSGSRGGGGGSTEGEDKKSRRAV